ncbi:MAG: SUMF1/EgtB/PvdO family nonheme iron enzyme [Protaetiibacter sp.]
MSDDELLDLAVKTTAGMNAVVRDDRGLPSVMVRIPSFRVSEVVEKGRDGTHPAFLVGGREVPEIYVSKYQNVVIDGRAYSLPGQDPAAEMTFDEAIGYCESKGVGWHLMTNAEWAAIALWCRANGFQPKGNNLLGKDVTESVQTAIPSTYDAAGRVAHVRTGTGPVTWSHNGEASGIYDLNGNVCEFVGGVRTVHGEIHLIPGDGAAAHADQSAGSDAWRAVLPDGTFVAPGTAGTLKYDFVADPARADVPPAGGVDGDGRWVLATEITAQSEEPRYCPFQLIRPAEGVEVPELFREQALVPFDNDDPHGEDDVYLNNGADEKVLNRGGAQHSHRTGGVFFYSGNGARDRRSYAIGFRAVYIPEC